MHFTLFPVKYDIPYTYILDLTLRWHSVLPYCSFIVLPYLGTMSSNLKQKLRTCFKNSLSQCTIKTILKSKNRPSSLFRYIDVIPKELQSHIVYTFSCSNCNITYYGKTDRHFNVRSSEHIGISHLTGKNVEYKPSAVSDHLLLHNHDGDFNDFTILCRDNMA